MIRLQAHNIAKQFRRKLLFSGIDFDAAGGERIAVTGPNGSGKSTFLKILGGLLRPTKGRVDLVLGETDVHADDHSFHFGYVAPATGVYGALSGRENIEFLQSFYRTPHNRSAHELLELVGLLEAADRPVEEYSSGMIQRIKLACALVGLPEVLLLDEPFSNLDTAGCAVVENVIEEQCGAGKLVIVATNVDAHANRCDRSISITDYNPVTTPVL